MTWEKLPAISVEDIHQGCLTCPPVESVASMEMVIAVGFGCAIVTKDEEIVYDERLAECAGNRFWRTLDAEHEASKDPDHDWRIVMDAPLRGRTYQRHGEDHWVCVASNQGFA